MLRLNLVGKRFNKLKVIKYAGTFKGRTYWICKCDCGNYKKVRGSHLTTNNTQSCGCIMSENNKTHGLSNTHLYSVWADMKDRRNNKNSPAYHNYGGRGISVCNEWKKSFEAFYNFALNNGFKIGIEIDRIDNDGNYEPSNVRFTTRKQNTRNRRNNTIITINGISKTLIEWAEKSGIGRATIGWRYKNGISDKDLLKPVGSFNGKYITVDGITKRLCEWAREIGIKPDTLAKRYESGHRDDKLLKPLNKA